MWAMIEKLRRRAWGMVTRRECSRSGCPAPRPAETAAGRPLAIVRVWGMAAGGRRPRLVDREGRDAHPGKGQDRRIVAGSREVRESVVGARDTTGRAGPAADQHRGR